MDTVMWPLSKYTCMSDIVCMFVCTPTVLLVWSNRFDITGFPTIKFFPKNNKESPESVRSTDRFHYPLSAD